MWTCPKICQFGSCDRLYFPRWPHKIFLFPWFSYDVMLIFFQLRGDVYVITPWILVAWDCGRSDILWLPRLGHKRYNFHLLLLRCLESHHHTVRKWRGHKWVIQPIASAEIPADYQPWLPDIWVNKHSDDSSPQLLSHSKPSNLPRWSFRHYVAETSCPHCALSLFLTHRICEHNITLLF